MDSNKDILNALNAIQATLAKQNRILLRNAAKQRKIELLQLHFKMLQTGFITKELSDSISNMIDETNKEEQQYEF